MAMPETADVLVIGGGPAGSCAATQLAQAGLDTVVIDKQHHPRETVGESVLPSAWRYFDLLGVSEDVEKSFVKKAGGVVVWGDEITQIAFRDFAYERPGLHVERAELDHLLLKNAKSKGARVFEGVKAENFSLNENGAEIAVVRPQGRQTISCKYFIDATGQASFVAQQLGGRRLDDDFRFVSLWGYFRDSLYVSSGGIVRAFSEIPHHPPMTFVARLGGWGWAWHIPMKHETSVGIVVPVEDYKKGLAQHGTLERYFLATCAATEHLGALLAKAHLGDGRVRMIRDFSYLPDRVAGPGYFVTGDAAGFVDPIFSIGVIMALYSGHLAAWAVQRCLRHPAQAESTRKLFETQMSGRYELARTMALPGVETDATQGAKTYFDFFSVAEKELMWSAASMTTRSGNMVRASNDRGAPAVLKRRELGALQFPAGAMAS
jgi:flavin-dependent dehydrogenase